MMMMILWRIVEWDWKQRYVNVWIQRRGMCIYGICGSCLICCLTEARIEEEEKERLGTALT